MSNYEIGYGKPPKASQFPTGKSGNPKGRPKGTKSAESIAKDLFFKPVTVTQNGKPTKMPVIAALLARLLATAMKGDHKAIKLAWDLYAKYAGSTNPSSMADLMAGHSVFDLTADDVASITKHKLLEGVS